MLHSDELITIFQYLSVKELAAMRCINRTWRKDADNPISWKHAIVKITTFQTIDDDDRIVKPISICNCRELILGGDLLLIDFSNRIVHESFIKNWIDDFTILLKTGLFTNLVSLISTGFYIITPLFIDTLRFAKKLSKLDLHILNTDNKNYCGYYNNPNINLTESTILLLNNSSLTDLRLSGNISDKIMRGLIDGLPHSKIITFSFAVIKYNRINSSVNKSNGSYPFLDLQDAISNMPYLKNLRVSWIPAKVGKAEYLIVREMHCNLTGFTNLRELHMLPDYRGINLFNTDNMRNIKECNDEFITLFTNSKLEKLTLLPLYSDINILNNNSNNNLSNDLYKRIFATIIDHKYLTHICIPFVGKADLCVMVICNILNMIGKCPVLKELSIIDNSFLERENGE
jgi:hypothetical protein